jgi:hypothetical protein
VESRVTDEVHTGSSDEIAKLAQLRDDGILSEEEFAKAKQRLVSGS